MRLLLLLVVLPLAVADSPRQDSTAELVRQLVQQLDANELAVREAAERQLLGLGAAALEHLPPPSDRLSDAARHALERVRRQLQLAAAEATAAAAVVTLRAEATPLPEVLAALEEQSGNRIIAQRATAGYPVANPPLTIQLDKVPFWQALDRVLDQAGLDVYPYGDERAICLRARPEGELPRTGTACYSGPFRFQPLQVHAVRNLRIADSHWLTLHLQVAYEPRVRPIYIRQRLAELVAVDDLGNVLSDAASPAGIEAALDGTSIAAELVLPLRPPPRQAQCLESLRGKLEVLLLGRPETFRFDNLLTAKNLEKRIAGATVTLEHVRREGDHWQVRMRVRFDQPHDALASHRGWIFKNEVYLEGNLKGQIRPERDYEITRQTPSEVGIAYFFALDEPPEKLTFVYKTPCLILAKTFPYELKGIKLP
jgi:hypothetical protein